MQAAFDAGYNVRLISVPRFSMLSASHIEEFDDEEAKPWMDCDEYESYKTAKECFTAINSW